MQNLNTNNNVNLQRINIQALTFKQATLVQLYNSLNVPQRNMLTHTLSKAQLQLLAQLQNI